MKMKIADGVYSVGAVDWDRRLFDSLVPLPDGTSYNSYLIEGSEKTALLDTVDPTKTETLLSNLAGVQKIDYVISHHAEQDHSGSIPAVLERYKGSKVVATPLGKKMLIDHLHIQEDRIITAEDGGTLSLGNKSLKFIHTPWVHWPETMVSYLEQHKILFTCDFFGSHLATSELYADEAGIYEPAKRYYAEIMMPFSKMIRKNLEKIAGYDIGMIAPSHGPVYAKPRFILDAYGEWVSEKPKNVVVLPYVTMHGSTEKMVERLAGALAEKGIVVEKFDLATTDVGELAMAMVDAATLVIGTPTVLAGPHPGAVFASFLINSLKPKVKFVSIIGSYGWGARVVEPLAALMSDLKVEMLEPILCKGLPGKSDYEAIDKLAEAIAKKHKELGLA